MDEPKGSFMIVSRRRSKEFWADGPYPPPESPAPVHFVCYEPRPRDKADFTDRLLEAIK